MDPFRIHIGIGVSNLSIKNVPGAVVEKLRQRAKRNHRSLQGELMVIVQAAAISQDANPPGRVAVSGPTAARKTIEQIAAEHRARHPEPLTDGPLAVDIIRAERDAR